MIYVVLPVHNRIELTRRCVRCLLEQTERAFHLVLVDDGCTDGTPQWVEEAMRRRSLTVLRGDGSLWWAGALQLAYDWLRARPAEADDAVLLLNDDVTFAPDFLAAGLACLDADRRRWVQAVMQVAGQAQRERGVEADLRRLRFRPASEPARINCLSTRGLMLDRAAFARSGGFRPRLLPHYLSDYEFTLRGARQGAVLASCEAFLLQADLAPTGVHEQPRTDLVELLRTAFSNRASFNPLHVSAFVLLSCPPWVVPLHLLRIWAGFLRLAVAAAGRDLLHKAKYVLRNRLWGVLRRLLPEEVTDRVNGMTLRYRVRGDLGHSLYLGGSFEQSEIDLVTRIARARATPQLVVLDVGANIGVHSIALCKSLPNARAVAFEPSAATRRLLEHNVRANGLAERIRIEPYALSNAAGIAQFFEMRDDAYSSLKDTRRKPLLNTAEVPVETLDRYVAAAGLTQLDLVKIDVEGFETEVVEGGMNTLRAMRPDLLVEIYAGRDSNPDPSRTIALLLGLGYRAWVMHEGRLLPYERHDDARYNYFFSVGGQ